MSDPQSNRKADRFRSAPRQEKIKPVAASRDVPGEMSSAFGRGNVVAEIVRFPSAEKKRTGLGPHPGKRKTKQVAVPRDQQKRTLCTFRSDFRGFWNPGTYNCRLKKRTGLGPPGFNWRPQVNLGRSWGIWVPTNARWPSTGARRMEPCASSGAGFACAHC